MALGNTLDRPAFGVGSRRRHPDVDVQPRQEELTLSPYVAIKPDDREEAAVNTPS
jgi:hypothetical protein